MEYGKYRERSRFAEFVRQRRSVIIIILSLAALAYLGWTGYRHLIDNYTVTRIYVDGNSQYTNQEIIDMVMQGPYGDNSLFLAWWYKDRTIEDVPFVAKMDIAILERDTIRISVYEKAVAGYVKYLGHYLYFDKDGIIVEASDRKTAGIPEVAGLRFDYAILHEKLPVKDAAVFAMVLSVRQMLEQYKVPADRIFISDKDEVTLYFDDIKVAMGNEGYIDDKIMALENILPGLDGASGVLHMEHYDEYSLEVIFEAD